MFGDEPGDHLGRGAEGVAHAPNYHIAGEVPPAIQVAACKVATALHGDPQAFRMTIRMSNRRYTRLTNAFSKKLRNHEHHNALHFLHYNFCRIHKSLRVSPAMEAGVTDVLRDTEWIVELIDARAPKPAKPGPKGPWKHKQPVVHG